MREILFKAKRIDNGEWVKGNLVLSNDALEGYEAIIVPQIGSHMFTKGVYYDLGIEKWYIVDKNTICQYTGFTDMKGNRIWENDIVKTYDYGGFENDLSHILWASIGINDGWCSKAIKSLDRRRSVHCSHAVGFGKTDGRMCKVIGNIFDNPELLGDSEV